MAPILSKPPPNTTEAKIGRLVNKSKPLLESIFELLKDVGNLGKVCKADVEEKFDFLRVQLDKACISCVGILESLCCLDLNRYARGSPGAPLTGSLPTLFVLFLVVMLYNAFVFGYMPAAGIAFNSHTSLSFHALIFMILSSFAQAVRTDPGRTPTSAKWRTKDFPPPEAKERKRGTNEARWCRKSEAYKPDRAHYCRVLRQGVLRMDHYCPWLGNTVGFYNQKFFFLFLMYTNAACAQIGVSFIQLLVQYTLPALTTFCLIGAEGLTLLISSLLIPFFLFHSWLIMRNMTTIEFCERMRSRNENESESEAMNPRDYNVGIFHNICSVMGSNPLLWLFPVGGPAGDGITFPTHADLDRARAIKHDDDGPEVTHPEASHVAEKTQAKGSHEDIDAMDHEDGDAVDLEGGCYVEEEEEEWQESGDECYEKESEGASSSQKEGGDGGFLVWRDSAEFIEDLTIGCQFIAEKTEDCTRGSMAFVFMSCVPGTWGRRMARSLTSSDQQPMRRPLRSSIKGGRSSTRAPRAAVRIVRSSEGEQASDASSSSSGAFFGD